MLPIAAVAKGVAPLARPVVLGLAVDVAAAKLAHPYGPPAGVRRVESPLGRELVADLCARRHARARAGHELVTSWSRAGHELVTSWGRR